jgi:hypothetical protein
MDHVGELFGITRGSYYHRHQRGKYEDGLGNFEKVVAERRRT